MTMWPIIKLLVVTVEILLMAIDTLLLLILSILPFNIIYVIMWRSVLFYLMILIVYSTLMLWYYCCRDDDTGIADTYSIRYNTMIFHCCRWPLLIHSVFDISLLFVVPFSTLDTFCLRYFHFLPFCYTHLFYLTFCLSILHSRLVHCYRLPLPTSSQSHSIHVRFPVVFDTDTAFFHTYASLPFCVFCSFQWVHLRYYVHCCDTHFFDDVLFFCIHTLFLVISLLFCCCSTFDIRSVGYISRFALHCVVYSIPDTRVCCILPVAMISVDDVHYSFRYDDQWSRYHFTPPATLSCLLRFHVIPAFVDLFICSCYTPWFVPIFTFVVLMPLPHCSILTSTYPLNRANCSCTFHSLTFDPTALLHCISVTPMRLPLHFPHWRRRTIFRACRRITVMRVLTVAIYILWSMIFVTYYALHCTVRRYILFIRRSTISMLRYVLSRVACYRWPVRLIHLLYVLMIRFRYTVPILRYFSTPFSFTTFFTVPHCRRLPDTVDAWWSTMQVRIDTISCCLLMVLFLIPDAAPVPAPLVTSTFCSMFVSVPRYVGAFCSVPHSVLCRCILSLLLPVFRFYTIFCTFSVTYTDVIPVVCSFSRLRPDALFDTFTIFHSCAFHYILLALFRCFRCYRYLLMLLFVVVYLLLLLTCYIYTLLHTILHTHALLHFIHFVPNNFLLPLVRTFYRIDTLLFRCCSIVVLLRDICSDVVVPFVYYTYHCYCSLRWRWWYRFDNSFTTRIFIVLLSDAHLLLRWLYYVFILIFDILLPFLLTDVCSLGTSPTPYRFIQWYSFVLVLHHCICTALIFVVLIPAIFVWYFVLIHFYFLHSIPPVIHILRCSIHLLILLIGDTIALLRCIHTRIDTFSCPTFCCIYSRSTTYFCLRSFCCYCYISFHTLPAFCSFHLLLLFCSVFVTHCGDTCGSTFHLCALHGILRFVLF